MKKIYLLALTACFGLSAMAQVSVTFRVDMNGQTVSPNGVHVAGSWQEEAGFGGDWNPGVSTMTDANADGIYELNVNIPAGQYEFKYLNGNDWPQEESIPNISQVGGGNSNRFFAVTAWHGSNPLDNDGNPFLPNGFLLPAITFGGSSPSGKVAVRLQIDMTNQTVGDLGVHVAGDAITPNWTPQYGTATLSANNKYAYVTHLDPNASYQYKFLNGDFWGTDESVPGACANGGNRIVVVETNAVIADPFCFATCDLCAPLVQSTVTFKVNMTQETVSPNGVHVAGNWQEEAGFGADWQPGASELLDGDGDGIYELDVALIGGTYAYKFINGNDWVGADNSNEDVPPACNVGNNREMVLIEGQNLIEFCYEQCTSVCNINPDPADITFRVDMSETAVSPDGVFIIGGFTNPVWQEGATQMTNTGNNVYAATLSVSGSGNIAYKFTNGAPTVVANEENFDFATGGCGVSNGFNGFNRTYTRSGEAETLEAVCYNSCAACVLGLEELELGNVSIFPNPSTERAFFRTENPNGYTLRMNIVDITGKTIRENMVVNTTVFEINTQDLNSGLYFLNVVNERNETATYKLMVQ